MTTASLLKSTFLTLQISDEAICISKGNLLVIGRSEPMNSAQPDIDLTPFGAKASGVSRRHLRIAYLGTQCIVSDLNSSNGTLLNGERLMPFAEYAVHDGDLLKLGQLRIMVRFQP